MEIWDFGKKFVGAVTPNIIFSGALIGIINYFKVIISLQDMFIYNIIFAITYIILWHEIRFRKIEEKGYDI
jgi:hypothetical protein